MWKLDFMEWMCSYKCTLQSCCKAPVLQLQCLGAEVAGLAGEMVKCRLMHCGALHVCYVVALVSTYTH